MKNNLIITLCILLSTFLSCNSKTEKRDENATQTQSVADLNEDFYFNFIVDGKEIDIKTDDVSTTYNTALKKPTFKIFTGKDGEPSILLTTTADMTKPSSTPSGSTDFAEQIIQGSVSLINYPKKNYVSNSFETGEPESSIPVPDAILITKSERVADGRIITGTFNVKVFGGYSKGNDPNVKDRIIKGKFRVKHIFTDVKF